MRTFVRLLGRMRYIVREKKKNSRGNTTIRNEIYICTAIWPWQYVTAYKIKRDKWSSGVLCAFEPCFTCSSYWGKKKTHRPFTELFVCFQLPQHREILMISSKSSGRPCKRVMSGKVGGYTWGRCVCNERGGRRWPKSFCGCFPCLHCASVGTIRETFSHHEHSIGVPARGAHAWLWSDGFTSARRAKGLNPCYHTFILHLRPDNMYGQAKVQLASKSLCWE
jgi:hypothetical protein